MTKKMTAVHRRHVVGTRLLLIIFSIVAGLSFLGFKGWTGADLVGTCGWVYCPTLDSIPQVSMRESILEAVVRPAIDRTVVMITPAKRGGASEGENGNVGAGLHYNLQDVLLSEEDEMQKTEEERKEGVIAESPADEGHLHSKRKARAGRPANSSADGQEEFKCDRSSPLTDVCTLQGDVRINVTSGQIVLFAGDPETPRGEEKVRPMPRKWDEGLMESGVSEFTLQSVDRNGSDAPAMECTHWNEAPAVLFSAGGYCGGVFFDFNEVYLPLFETTHGFDHDVVLLVADLKGDWWWQGDPRGSFVGAMTWDPVRVIGRERGTKGNVHGVECFSHVIVGLYQNFCLYDEYEGKEWRKFARSELKEFAPFVREGLEIADPPESHVSVPRGTAPVIGIAQRSESRRLLNHEELLRVAEGEGFTVTPLVIEELTHAEVAAAMAPLDVLVGVHGDGLSSISLMRPGGIVLQILPYGEGGPRNIVGAEYKNLALEMEIDYHEWRVPAHESSLSDQYNCTNEFVASPLMTWTHNSIQDALNVYHNQDVVMPADMFAAYLSQFKRILHAKAALAQELR